MSGSFGTPCTLASVTHKQSLGHHIVEQGSSLALYIKEIIGDPVLMGRPYLIVSVEPAFCVVHVTPRTLCSDSDTNSELLKIPALSELML